MKKALIVLASGVAACSSPELTPPDAVQHPEELLFVDGEIKDTRIDNYYWMRLSDEQKNSETPDKQTQDVLDYLEAENQYTAKVMAHTEEFQNTLFDEITSRIPKSETSTPIEDNGYFYYKKYLEGNEYPIHYRRKGSMDGEEEVLLDINKVAEGHSFCNVSAINVSPDNNTLSYGVDFIGRNRYDIVFVDLKNNKIIKDKLINTQYGATAWASNSKDIFYIEKDPVTLRGEKVKKHHLGDDQSLDQLKFHEKDETFNLSIDKTKSKEYIYIHSDQTLSSEVLILDSNTPDAKFEVFNPRESDHIYYIDHVGDKFYILTNSDGDINFRLAECSPKSTHKDQWETIIPNRDDILLESFEVFKDWLVIHDRKDGLADMRIINKDSKSEHSIDFGEESYSANLSSNGKVESDLLRYSYTSLTTPSSIIEYNMRTDEKKILKESEVIGDFDKSSYKTKRIWATADDGISIPISLVSKKGIKLDGSNPLLLYAYGSYGSSTDARFSATRLSLLDRGFVFAIAHIRGGSDMGYQWYLDGKLLKKINTFSDFNSCAEELTKLGYTSADRLFAQGGSAGGLLMGAIVNMKPELYKGILSAVPFVDVVTTMQDPTIPLTTFEWDEWGDPREEPYYSYMKSYSPYDQIKAIDYPNILVTTGYWDSQVQYWEPAKYVAKLRDYKTDSNILLLKTNMSAGHGGASGRFERYRETALQYSFILDLVR